MKMAADYRTKWAAAGALVAAGYLWAWWQTPVDPAGEESVVEPFLLVLTMTLPAGVVLAIASARFAARPGIARAIAWATATGYGVWVSGWTAVMAIWSGHLFYCGDRGLPACFTGWAPRVVSIATAAGSLGACVVLESRLRERWASGPS